MKILFSISLFLILIASCASYNPKADIEGLLEIELPDCFVEVENPTKDNQQALEVVELKFEAECLDELFELFIANTDFIVEYIYSEELPFDDYIQFRVVANGAIHRVRDFFSWDEQGEAYDGVYGGFDNYYEQKYPLRISTVNASFLQSQE
jgi:hypothetical protein